jgi:hypothetical protein
MRRILAERRWVIVLRVLLVAGVTQPTAAALIHDAAARWPAVAAVIAAVEGLAAYLATRGTTLTPEQQEAWDAFAAALRRGLDQQHGTSTSVPPPVPPGVPPA